MKRILIVKLSSLGDIVHLSWVLPALKKTYPEVMIDWTVNKPYEKLLSLFKDINKVIPIDLKMTLNPIVNIKKVYSLWGKIRLYHYDAVIDAQGLLRSALVTGISRSHRKIGFAPPDAREGSHLFYQTQSINTVDKINVLDKNLSLFHEIGIKGYEACRPDLDLSRVDLTRVNQFLNKNSNIKKVLFNPSASFYTKNYPLDKITELAEAFRQAWKSPLIVLNNGKNQDFDKIRKHSDIVLTPVFSLDELLIFLQKCDALIGVDSGPSYMAELVGIPSLILFGPTNLKRQSPSESLDPKLQSVFYYTGKIRNLSVYSGYSCPIIKSRTIISSYRCLNRNCSNNLCMQGFSSDAILRQVKKIIS